MDPPCGWRKKPYKKVRTLRGGSSGEGGALSTRTLARGKGKRRESYHSEEKRGGLIRALSWPVAVGGGERGKKSREQLRAAFAEGKKPLGGHFLFRRQ